MKNKKRVLVLFGGQSSEHKVSCVSAASVIRNIDRDLFDVAMLGITGKGEWIPYVGPIEHIEDGTWEPFAKHSMIEMKKNKMQEQYNPTAFLQLLEEVTVFFGIDVVFPVLHGAYGEDGVMQGILEISNKPYVGCGVLASALGMDKEYSKILFRQNGIPVGPYLTFTRHEIEQGADYAIDITEEKLHYPCFVKPANTGSSIGINKANDKKELESALQEACQFDRKILIESFIEGREVECAVLGNMTPIASTVGEIRTINPFYDFEAKYSEGKTKMIIPAELPQKTMDLIQSYAITAFKALGCRGLSRVDFFVASMTNEVYINEINTMPGFTNASMYPKLWEASGMTYTNLLSNLINFAFENYESGKRRLYQ